MKKFIIPGLILLFFVLLVVSAATYKHIVLPGIPTGEKRALAVTTSTTSLTTSTTTVLYYNDNEVAPAQVEIQSPTSAIAPNSTVPTQVITESTTSTTVHKPNYEYNYGVAPVQIKIQTPTSGIAPNSIVPVRAIDLYLKTTTTTLPAKTTTTLSKGAEIVLPQKNIIEENPTIPQ